MKKLDEMIQYLYCKHMMLKLDGDFEMMYYFRLKDSPLNIGIILSDDLYIDKIYLLTDNDLGAVIKEFNNFYEIETFKENNIPPNEVEEYLLKICTKEYMKNSI